MSAPTIASENQWNLSRITPEALIIVALTAVACLQVALALGKSINWDEFWHFSLIHAHLRGEPVGAFQKPFVYLFSWVPQLPGSTIEHIQIIRTLLLPFQLLLIAATVCVAARFTDRKTALMCGLAYATAGYAFTQGLALRADVISASLMMTALAVALHRRFSLITCSLIAVLMALAFVSTIKAVLYLPGLVAVAVHRWRDLKPWLSAALIVGVCAIGIAEITEPAAYLDIQRKLTGSAQRMFGGGLLPQATYLQRQLIFAPIFTGCLVVFVVWLARTRQPIERQVILALFALPALWPLIYFNAYPYFFAFILPPVAVAIAPAIKIACDRYGTKALAGLICLNAAALWVADPSERLTTQEQVQTNVRSYFPDPVVYIDESGMIADYPRAVAHFASGWALENYRAKGTASYRQQLEQRTVPLLLANSFALINVFEEAPIGDRLLDADEAALRENFVHHSGMIYVAGKAIAPGSHLTSQENLVPGLYRVEGASVRVDDAVAPVGSTIALERRAYTFANLSDTQSATLRWEAAGEPRASSIGLQDLFTDY